jgi:hypothetical protein
MADAMILAENIIKHPDNLITAVKNYETWMFPTACSVTERTWKSLLDRFEEGGSAKFVSYINGEREKMKQKSTAANQHAELVTKIASEVGGKLALS